MPMIPDLTLTSKQLLLALVNQATGKSYTDQQVTFSAPVPRLADPTYNTDITVNALTGSGYTGQKPLRYRRLDIGLFFGALVSIDPEGVVATTKHEALTAINTQLNLNLQTYEVVDGPVDMQNDSEIVLTITNDSELWMPGSTVSVALGGIPAGTYLDMGGGNLLGLDANTLLDIT